MTASAVATIDPAEFGKAMGRLISEATAPILRRLAELEARQLEKGEPGPPGKDGADAPPVEVKEVVAELLASDELRVLASLEAAQAVAKHFEANPVRHGVDGKPGERGEAGPKGDSIKGADGADGVGLAGAMIDRDGQLVITTTKGEAIKLGAVVGRDGAPGRDGSDLSDVEFDYDGHRTISVKARDGRVAKSYKLSIPLDKGYWREGMSAEAGDILTHAGNAWIAIKDTAAKPCVENGEHWRLFARKGRDGADGRPGRDLGPVQPVKLASND